MTTQMRPNSFVQATHPYQSFDTGPTNSYHWTTRSKVDSEVQVTPEPARLISLLDMAFPNEAPVAGATVRTAHGSKGRSLQSRIVQYLITCKTYCNCKNTRSVESLEQSGLNKEIKTLRERRAAMAAILEEVEAEVGTIEQRLEDRMAHQMRLAKVLVGQRRNAQGDRWSSCCNLDDEVDPEEIETHSDNPDDLVNWYSGRVDLRPLLRTKIEELQSSLLHKESEIRHLQRELSTQQSAMQRTLATPESRFIERVEEKGIETKKASREKNFHRHAAAINHNEGFFLSTVFKGWHTWQKQRHFTMHMMRQSMHALSGESVAVGFSCWKEYSARRKQLSTARKDGIMRRFARVIANKSHTTTLRTIFVAWWEDFKSSEAAKRLTAVEEVVAKQEHEIKQEGKHEAKAEAKAEAQKGQQCCALM